jgi:hypothetical protein
MRKKLRIRKVNMKHIRVERPMRPNDPKLSHGHGNNAKDVR